MSAECLFVDPIGDLAVLGAPDGQMWFEASEAYDRLLDDRSTLRIGEVQQGSSAWLLTLDGHWEPCTVNFGGWAQQYVSLTNTTTAAYARGTSGSPILDAEGRVIGLVSVGKELNPVLANGLPRWLLSVPSSS